MSLYTIERTGLLGGRELVDRGLVVRLARLELTRREFGLIGRIREVLGFKTKRRAARVDLAALPVDRSV